MYRKVLTIINNSAWARIKGRNSSFLVNRRLNPLLDRGELLDETTRSEMEAALGYELSDVCIYETRTAGKMAQKLNAEAFTIGKNIYADEGKLNTSLTNTKALLVHELTHVIQQTRPKYIGPFRTEKAKESVLISTGPYSNIMNNSPNSTFLPALQLASTTNLPFTPANSTGEAMEMIARRNEQIIGSGLNMARKKQTPSINVEEISDIVYRLIKQDLLLENDRTGR